MRCCGGACVRPLCCHGFCYVSCPHVHVCHVARTTCQQVVETCSKQKQEWDAERKMVIETHQKLIQEQTQAFESNTQNSSTAPTKHTPNTRQVTSKCPILYVCMSTMLFVV